MHDPETRTLEMSSEYEHGICFPGQEKRACTVFGDLEIGGEFIGDAGKLKS